MPSPQVTRSILVVLMSLFTVALSTTPAGAQTAPTTSYMFTVNTTADTHDAHPGDGRCANSNGQCSLRAAIEEGNALPSGSSIAITVPAGTYGLTLGTLKLTGKRMITITGAGRATTIIQGNSTFGIMRIASYTSASFSQFTLTGGSAVSGGGIDNGGTLTLSSVTVSVNTATSGGGGGIDNGGTLSVSNSTFSNNSATSGNGGGIDNDNGSILSVINSTVSGNTATSGFGGGIFNSGTLSVSSSTFSGNFAIGGGGIFNNSGGALKVSSSTLSDNSAYYGGGIENLGALTVSASTLNDNSVTYDGGSIENLGALKVSSSTLSGNAATTGGGIFNNSGGALSVSNSTFSDNSAYYGGGIFNNSGGTLTLSASTLSDNSASYGGGDIDNYYEGGPVTLTSTIVANSPTGGNCAGTITDGGYNLDSGTSCGFTNHALTNTNPKLGPLSNNGGPTQTMAFLLLQGSLAIDYVPTGDCAATDQRGVVRPDNHESSCDIGAYESIHIYER